MKKDPSWTSALILALIIAGILGWALIETVDHLLNQIEITIQHRAN